MARSTKASHVSVAKHASDSQIAAMTIAPCVVRIHYLFKKNSNNLKAHSNPCNKFMTGSSKTGKTEWRKFKINTTNNMKDMNVTSYEITKSMRISNW